MTIQHRKLVYANDAPDWSSSTCVSMRASIQAISLSRARAKSRALTTESINFTCTSNEFVKGQLNKTHSNRTSTALT